MKKILLFCVALILAAGFSDARNKKNDDGQNVREWNYEVETLSKNGHGEYVLKVWHFAQKPQVSIEQGKMNALHAVIFKGVAASKNGRVPGIRALIPSLGAEEVYADFLNSFFAENGDYKKFVTLSNNGFADIIKIGKVKDSASKAVYKYKVGQTVTVNLPALRKYLESAGLIKSLNSGF